MRLGGESDPRNKALMKMFNLINIGERAGSGVPNIFNVWADEGWEEPVIEERFDPDRTLFKMLQKAVAKQNPNEYEPWQKALMCAVGQKCDWTDKSYLEPLLKYIEEFSLL